MQNGGFVGTQHRAAASSVIYLSHAYSAKLHNLLGCRNTQVLALYMTNSERFNNL